MAVERRCRAHCESWSNIIKELHIDRGSLLGSERFNELSGVEQADTLKEIDSRINQSFNMIEEIHQRREIEIPVKRGFGGRCARIRRLIQELDGGSLVVKE